MTLKTDGVDDLVVFDIPGVFTGDWTMFGPVKRPIGASTSYKRIFALANAAGDETLSIVMAPGGNIAVANDQGYSESSVALLEDEWTYIAIRYSTTTQNGCTANLPRMSAGPAGGSVVHGNPGSGVSPAGSTVGGTAYWGCDVNGGTPRDFAEIIGAGWRTIPGVVLNDAEIVALFGASLSEYAAVGGGAGALWPFDQPDISTPIEDLLNGHDEVSRVGTTVVDDTPPSDVFVFFADPAGPANLSAPVVSGVPTVNETLTTTNGTWSGYPSPDFTYQWQRNTGSWIDIDGETSSTYVLAEDDATHNVRCIVTASNTEDDASEPSNALGPVSLPPQLNFSVRLTGGASNADTTQSIGGEESSEELGEIPDANALMRTITHDEAGNGVTYYRAVTVHNDEPTDAGTVVAYITGQVPGAPQIAIGVALEAWGDAPEEIADEFTPPADVTFSEATTAETGVDMGTGTAGDGRGLWTRITIPSETRGDATNPWRLEFEVTPL